MSILDITVELFYSGAWHEVPVYTRDPIQITRGRANESQRIAPSTASLSLDNRTYAYSPRNPTSTLYGLIGRNTPIRITANSSVRFVGEVESWPQRSNVKGNDVWVPISANGILRRLNAPGTTAPAFSALRRSINSTQSETYWPLEDGVLATQSGSASAAPAMRTVGEVTFASDDALLGSLAVPDLSLGALFGTVVGVSSTSWHCEFLVNSSFISGAIARLYVDSTNLAVFRFFPASAAGQPVQVFVTDTSGSTTGTLATANVASSWGDAWHHIAITAEQNGGNVDLELFMDGVSEDTTSIAGTLGEPTEYWANHQYDVGVAANSFGHISIGSGTTISDSAAAMDGYVGELAADRIERLCNEDGIAITIIGDATESEAMGVQRVAKFLDLLYDAVDVDSGFLFEPRDSLGLAFRVHTDLYNQDPVLELDYAAGGEVAPPLDPVEDTDATGNDITVTRLNGSSARAIRETGPLNVQEPTDDPQGVGRYKKDYTLALENDDQCGSQASWRRHLGTWDEARFPVVNLDVTAMEVDHKTSLMTDAKNLDIGDRFTIFNPPSWLPPEDIVQHAQGFKETLDAARWTIAVNATPALPYEALELESTSGNRGRIPPARGATTTNEALDKTETGVDIISTSVRWIDSTSYASQFPFDIMIGGERMRVTAISGTTLTQTMTVVRSVNGIYKNHATGAEVQLFNPPVVAL